MDISQILKDSLDKVVKDSGAEIKQSLDKLIDEKAQLIEDVSNLKIKKKKLEAEVAARQQDNKQVATAHIFLEEKTADLETLYKNTYNYLKEEKALKEQEIKKLEQNISDLSSKNQAEVDRNILETKERLEVVRNKETLLQLEEENIVALAGAVEAKEKELATKTADLATRTLALEQKERQLNEIARDLEPKYAEVNKKLDELNNGILVKTSELKTLSQKVEARQKELTLEKKAVILKEQDLKKREIRLADREAVNNFNSQQ